MMICGLFCREKASWQLAPHTSVACGKDRVWCHNQEAVDPLLELTYKEITDNVLFLVNFRDFREAMNLKIFLLSKHNVANSENIIS